MQTGRYFAIWVLSVLCCQGATPSASVILPMTETQKQGALFIDALSVPSPGEVFVAMNKAAIVRRGAELGVDFSHTWSCYKGGEIHCGTCGTCVERREAFLIAGIPDPTAYLKSGPLPLQPELKPESSIA